MRGGKWADDDRLVEDRDKVEQRIVGMLNGDKSLSALERPQDSGLDAMVRLRGPLDFDEPIDCIVRVFVLW